MKGLGKVDEVKTLIPNEASMRIITMMLGYLGGDAHTAVWWASLIG